MFCACSEGEAGCQDGHSQLERYDAWQRLGFLCAQVVAYCPVAGHYPFHVRADMGTGGGGGSVPRSAPRSCAMPRLTCRWYDETMIEHDIVGDAL